MPWITTAAGCKRLVSDATILSWKQWAILHPLWKATAIVAAVGCGGYVTGRLLPEAPPAFTPVPRSVLPPAEGPFVYLPPPPIAAFEPGVAAFQPVSPWVPRQGTGTPIAEGIALPGAMPVVPWDTQPALTGRPYHHQSAKECSNVFLQADCTRIQGPPLYAERTPEVILQERGREIGLMDTPTTSAPIPVPEPPAWSLLGTAVLLLLSLRASRFRQSCIVVAAGPAAVMWLAFYALLP